MIGKVLGHRQARTTEGNAHLAADPVRALPDRTAARIVATMRRSSEPGTDEHSVPTWSVGFTYIPRVQAWSSSPTSLGNTDQTLSNVRIDESPIRDV